MKLQSKINALCQESISQEDLMRKLAQFDENGHISNENLEKLRGGVVGPPFGPDRTNGMVVVVRDNKF